MRELLITLKVETFYSEFSQNVNEAVDVLLDARFLDSMRAFIDIEVPFFLLLGDSHI